MAAAFGHADVAKALIEAGAEINVHNKSGSTPLHLAAFLCYPEIVQALVDAGADLEAKDNQGGRPVDVLLIPWDKAKGICDFIDKIVYQPPVHSI